MRYTEYTHSGGIRDLRTRRSLLSILIPLALTQTGCVGPTSPFGALNSLFPTETSDNGGEEATAEKVVQIRFLPRKQILHDKSDLVVEIHDKDSIPSLEKLKVFFNNVDVTNSFLSNINVKNRIKEQILEIEFKEIRLKTLDDNLIKITYQKGNTVYYSRFDAVLYIDVAEKRIGNINVIKKYF